MIEFPNLRWHPNAPWSRLVARLRDDRGIGLIELLIALLVLNVGIFATLAAFTSGAVALRRASHISTATAIADKYTECMRNSPYNKIQWPMTASGCSSTSPVGADGRTYNVSATVTQASQGTGGSGQVLQVTLTVSDPKDNTVHVSQTSTFSRCTQAALNTSDTTSCHS